MVTLQAQLDQQYRDVEGALEAYHLLVLQGVEESLVRTRGEGGRLRVDTGFLRASLRSSTAAMPRVNPEFDRDPSQTYPPPDLGAGLEATWRDDVYLAFTARYAAAREKHDMMLEGVLNDFPVITQEAEQAVVRRFVSG